VAVDRILRTNQNNAPGASGLNYELVTWLEPSLAQGVNRQGSLIFGADARVTSPPLLYFRHKQ